MTLHEKIVRLTADEALAFLVYLGDAATGAPQPEPKPDDRSPIAYLFDAWLTGVQRIDGSDGQSMSDEDVTGDDPEPRSHAGRLVAEAHAALGIA